MSNEHDFAAAANMIETPEDFHEEELYQDEVEAEAAARGLNSAMEGFEDEDHDPTMDYMDDSMMAAYDDLTHLDDMD